MGVRNYLIEGVSGTGKTSVCSELERRGYHAIHGDRVLAYQGDPKTGKPLQGLTHEHHIWDVDKLKSLLADQSHTASFFCGGSRNFNTFLELFDGVFVLEIDLDTLHHRLDARPGEWGSEPAERALIVRLHASKQDIPQGAIIIDASLPLAQVVDDILARCRAVPGSDQGGC